MRVPLYTLTFNERNKYVPMHRIQTTDVTQILAAIVDNNRNHRGPLDYTLVVTHPSEVVQVAEKAK